MKQSNIYYPSEDLTFVATTILLGKTTIEKVLLNPYKPGVKIFYLSPIREAQKLFRLYISDQLQVSPQQLNSKISAIRYLPVTQEGEI
jgi:hypothetical protein